MTKAFNFILALILCAGILFMLNLKKCNRLKEVKITSALIKKADSTSYFKDKYNRLWAKSQIIESDLSTLKLLNTKQADSIKSISKRLGISQNRINEILSHTVASNTDFADKPDTVWVSSDTCNFFISKIFTDGYTTNFVIANQDSVWCKTTTVDTLTTVSSWEKMHKFLWFIRQRKVFYVQAASANPNAKIVNLSKIKLK